MAAPSRSPAPRAPRGPSRAAIFCGCWPRRMPTSGQPSASTLVWRRTVNGMTRAWLRLHLHWPVRCNERHSPPICAASTLPSCPAGPCHAVPHRGCGLVSPRKPARGVAIRDGANQSLNEVPLEHLPWFADPVARDAVIPEGTAEMKGYGHRRQEARTPGTSRTLRRSAIAYIPRGSMEPSAETAGSASVRRGASMGWNSP
jgi:hypothetical protein